MVIISAWCRNRSRIAVADGTSPISLPQSSSGRLEVIIVDLVSYRRMIISKRYSPDLFGNCFMPISSIINRSGFRYWASTLSWSAKASSCRKSLRTSKTERYRTVNPALMAWYPMALFEYKANRRHCKEFVRRVYPEFLVFARFLTADERNWGRQY